jgi:hypothetical protein
VVEASGKHSSKCLPDYNIYTAYSGNLSPGETNSLFQRTADLDANFVSGFLAHETLAQIQKFDPTFSRPVLNVSASKMHLPQYQKWSLEWQQAIGARTSAHVGARYCLEQHSVGDAHGHSLGGRS